MDTVGDNPSAVDSSDSVIARAEACLSDLEQTQTAFVREYQAKPGTFVSPSDLPLHASVRRYLAEQPYLSRGLYVHQHRGINEVLAGRHTVVSTPTSSGKSLIFGIPAIDAMARDPGATALLLYPQKALANDQLGKFRDMVGSVLGGDVARSTVARYDGATPTDARAAIRRDGRLILTNPDMLHLAILQHHAKWSRFFSNLKYVVIDEAHDYRGIFGSSVAFIIRRLRAVAKRYGSTPTFISASATIHEPRGHLRRLTGLEFVEVPSVDDGSIQGRKRFWILKTQEHFYKTGRDLTMAMVRSGLSCLTFCPSRVTAERLLDDLPETVRRDDRIRVYRAGLSSAERERIERGLSDGSIKGVFSTSALELGIDIGSLDAVVCVGLPNTMMSLWQRAGRVGRAGKEGAIFFIAADTPLDSYYAEHPEELFRRDHEPLAVNLQNRRLVCHHLACAIDEASEERLLDFDALGPEAQHAMELRQVGRLNHEVFYSQDKHSQTPIRSSDGRNFKLMVGAEEVGEIDQWHLLREAYPHAIYLHGGRRFRVDDIFRSRQEVRLHIERSANRTVPVIRKAVRIRRVRSVSEYPGVIITEADLEVTERLIGIQEKKPDGQTATVFEGGQGMPPHRLPTEGVCIEIRQPVLGQLDALVAISSGTGVYTAVERLIGALFPVLVGPCDTKDFDTFCERRDESVLLYLYDQVHDGIDLSVQAYSQIDELLDKALERVRSCDCVESSGCFRCVRNPAEEEQTDKESCARVLEHLLQHLRESTPRSRTFSVDVLEEQPESFGECPLCKAPVRADARFCSGCGEKIERG
jgi:DEAD/DEAH box helicase domain-containing protein